MSAHGRAHLAGSSQPNLGLEPGGIEEADEREGQHDERQDGGGDQEDLCGGRCPRAEGERAELEAFLQAVRDSGLRRNIRDEEIVYGEGQDNFRGFEITG